ncbi:MAG: hypothetical protein J2P58_08540 [Acidimicrobiaceae bacterium]|nr:hypothetical protein [Acidimicrobiaceae bacterium]
MTVLKVLSFLAGAVIVLLTLFSAIRATILPRAVNNRLGRFSIRVVRAGTHVWTGRAPSYESRDRVMAMFGPMVLLVMLVGWLVLIVSGYMLIFLGRGEPSVRKALELSGSSIFTLGTVPTRGLVNDLLSFSEAGIGLLLVTLLITYLPSIYSAFARRENGVARLRVRAGTPPSAAGMLIRYHRIDGANVRLIGVWQTWESWFVDVEESHTSFPILAYFRSPQPTESWITAAGTLLDTAAMWQAVVVHPPDPNVQLCIRAGFQALQRIADSQQIPYNNNPSPTDPVTISREEWDESVEEMAAAGVPIVADRDAAWEAWKGWRVNYDTILLDLARLVEAPPVPWVSDRSPLPDSPSRRLHRARRVLSRGDNA